MALRQQRGQGAAEFCLTLPFLILALLGVIQAGLIFINIFMAKYTAYMAARVAVAYPDLPKAAEAQGAKAVQCLQLVAGHVNNCGRVNIRSVIRMLPILAKNKAGLQLKFDDIKIKGADKRYRKVTVRYFIQLKIPVVNKMVGGAVMRYFLTEEDKVGLILQGLTGPVFPVRASAIMRTEE